MSDTFEFPDLVTPGRIETGMMRTARSRTFAVHGGCPLVVWSGRHRIGKTTTARWLEEEINEACAARPDDPRAFRAVYYEVGEIGDIPSAPKLAIRGLMRATVGRPDRGDQLVAEPGDMAEVALAGLRRLNIRMVFIDEAGLLSERAIGGLVLVRDLAKESGWPLTIVLIGMDDLPIKLQARAQVLGRVHDWISFDPYTLEETAELLATIDPAFAGLDLEDEEDARILHWVHETFDGVPGEMAPFIRRLRPRLERGFDLSVSLLRSAHIIMVQDKKRMTNASRKWSQGRGR